MPSIVDRSQFLAARSPVALRPSVRAFSGAGPSQGIVLSPRYSQAIAGYPVALSADGAPSCARYRTMAGLGLGLFAATWVGAMGWMWADAEGKPRSTPTLIGALVGGMIGVLVGAAPGSKAT